ncbi:MAG: hypothetical protein IJW13_04310 [Clostridia bacterium]|nr:hypothetical protein [Clostridia bacterium]
MKRLIVLCLTVLLCLCCFTSCSRKALNKWFSQEILQQCLVEDLPIIEKHFIKENDKNIYVHFSKQEFNEYLNEIYQYLRAQNFEYFGTRGNLHSSLSGAFSTYCFEPAIELEQFKDSYGDYRFVYSDGEITNGNGELTFCIIIINSLGFEQTKTLEYGFKDFEYNFVISIRYNSEAPFGGRYILHEHTGQWVVNENTHYYQYTCGCPSYDIAGEHSDADKDYKCDVCGYPVGEVAIEWLYSETHHWWKPSGEFAVEDVVYGYGTHVNGDEDEFCDVCGYQMGLPPEPTNYFIRDQAGCEWLNWVEVEDILEVKTTTEYVGVAPGNLKNCFSTTDKKIIADIFEKYYWLDSYPIKSEEGEIDGGSAFTVKFVAAGGREFELYFNNGNYRDSNGSYFKLLYIPSLANEANTVAYHEFVSYAGKAEVCNYGDSSFVCEIPVEKVQFVKITENIGLPDVEPAYVVKTEFGNLIFVTYTVFYVQGSENNYYQLVNCDLNEIIKNVLAPDYSITMNNKTWLYEELPSTAKAGEWVTVKIGMAYDVGYLFLVNGKKIATCNYVGGLYWEFAFIMPNCNAVIDFKTYDGFLPHYNYSVLIESYWPYHINANSVWVDKYCGEYKSGAIAALMYCDCCDYGAVVVTQFIAGCEFVFSSGKGIEVLYEGRFYSLQTAYDNGYLTAADVQNIYTLFTNN